MKTVHDRSWQQKGLSLFWGADVLPTIANLNEIVSLRELVRLSGNWPERLPSGNGNTIVAAGLEACIDVLDPSDAKSWIDVTLKKVILDFQDHYDKAGLILWIAGGDRRIRPDTLGESYIWRCSAPHGQETLPLGRILFSGAETDVRRIITPADNTVDIDGPAWIGLHHPRIS